MTKSVLAQFGPAIVLTILILTAAVFAQVNVVYIESNVGQVSGKNSVFALKNDGKGKLTPIKGSPFLTGGTGVFEMNSVFAPGFSADQEIVVNTVGTLLFAVNGDSDTITSFAINSDGSLTKLATAASNGQDPVSIGLDEISPAGPQMTVVNQANDPNQTGGVPNATSFTVDLTTGILTPVANSTITFPTGNAPTQALVSPSGKFVFMPAGSTLYSFSVEASGLLILNNTQSGAGFIGEAANPKQRALYVGMAAVNQFAVDTYNMRGELALSRIVVDPGSLPSWFTINSAGTHLYVVESGTRTITLYNIGGANVLNPQQLQHLTLSASTDVPTNLKLDPTGEFLYVLGLQPNGQTPGNFLHVLNVSSIDGTLTETQTPIKIPVRNGEVPMGLAVVLK